MAVVVDPKDVDEFMSYAKEENLEATKVAVVTEEPRLVLIWRGKEIVNLSRAFLDTNGAHQETNVEVEMPEQEGSLFRRNEIGDVRAAWLNTLGDLNVCSQKGLVEMFDGSIGAGSVFMPHGGKISAYRDSGDGGQSSGPDRKYRQSFHDELWIRPISVKLEPVSRCCLCSDRIHSEDRGLQAVITGRFALHSRSISAVCLKIRSAGASLLQLFLGRTRHRLDLDFRQSEERTVCPELSRILMCRRHLYLLQLIWRLIKTLSRRNFKKAGNKLVWLRIEKDEYDLPVYDKVMEQYGKLQEDIHSGRIVSAYALDRHGVITAVSKMAFGNHMGVKIEHNMDPRDMFAPAFGDIIAEVEDGQVGNLQITYTVIGEGDR